MANLTRVLTRVRAHKRDIAALAKSKNGATLIGDAYAKLNIARILRAPRSRQRALEKILREEGSGGLPAGLKNLDAFYSPGEIERMASFVEGGDSAASVRRTIQSSSQDTF